MVPRHIPRHQTWAVWLHCQDGPSAIEVQNPLLSLDPIVCHYRDLPHEIFWTHSLAMVFNNNILLGEFVILTDYMHDFRTGKRPVLHLCQRCKHWCMDLYACLFLVKVKKIFWKMIAIFWFFIFISSWKFLGSLINYCYCCTKDYSKNYKCILESGFIKSSHHQLRSV